MQSLLAPEPAGIRQGLLVPPRHELLLIVTSSYEHLHHCRSLPYDLHSYSSYLPALDLDGALCKYGC